MQTCKICRVPTIKCGNRMVCTSCGHSEPIATNRPLLKSNFNVRELPVSGTVVGLPKGELDSIMLRVKAIPHKNVYIKVRNYDRTIYKVQEPTGLYNCNLEQVSLLEFLHGRYNRNGAILIQC